MNEKLEGDKKDIKPERPDTSSNRTLRRTGGEGFLFSSLFTIVNFIGLLILFFWFFNTSGNQQEAGQNFVERISYVEETLDKREAQIEEFISSIDADLKFVNKEIRKLWDLSNKRNRKNISANLNSIEELKEKFSEVVKQNETLSAQLRALNLELAKTSNIAEKMDKKIQGLNLDSDLSSNNDEFDDIQESIDSINAYRVQVNQTLISLKEKINELELIIADPKNQ